MSIGLALSGGGAKGATHIGVLQALNEEGINIDYISGTSSGSIISSLYAAGYSPLNILNLFNIYCKNIADYDKLIPFKIMGTLFTGKISLCGLAKGDKLERILNSYFRQRNIVNISDITMPLAIPAVDLYTGEVIYFLSKPMRNIIDIDVPTLYDDTPSYVSNGHLASIVRASSSFPVVFEPKMIDGRVLVDGGVRVNTPISILRKMGADKVIAINFDSNTKYQSNDLNIVSVAARSFDIMGHQVNTHELEGADIVIRPEIENVSLLECRKTNKLAKDGYNYIKKNIDEIREKIK